jgi:hypothetical protein
MKKVNPGDTIIGNGPYFAYIGEYSYVYPLFKGKVEIAKFNSATFANRGLAYIKEVVDLLNGDTRLTYQDLDDGK